MCPETECLPVLALIAARASACFIVMARPERPAALLPFISSGSQYLKRERLLSTLCLLCRIRIKRLAVQVFCAKFSSEADCNRAWRWNLAISKPGYVLIECELVSETASVADRAGCPTAPPDLLVLSEHAPLARRCHGRRRIALPPRSASARNSTFQDRQLATRQNRPFAT